MCGMRDERTQRRLFARKKLTFTNALEEALSAEAATANTRAVRSALKSKTTPVHHQGDCEDGESSQDEAEEELGASSSPKGAVTRVLKCASCGGSHPRPQCKFWDAQCRACGKMGHIARACLSTKRWGKVEDKKRPTTRSKPSSPTNACQQIQAIRPIPSKLRVTTFINGTPCPMEIDSGSAFSIISRETLLMIPRRASTRLKPLGVRLTDFQGKRVPVAGVGTFSVSFKNRQARLPLVVVEGPRTSLLGLDWFQSLGITVEGINRIQETSLENVCQAFPEVFDGSLGCYTGPPVSFQLDPTVAPIRLKARRVPFALKEKIDAELDKLLAQGVLEPVSHAMWETPIVTPIKPDGSVRICADYKCTLNKALQQHAYPVPVVSHLLASLAGGKLFAKLDQQLSVDAATAQAQTIVTHRGRLKLRDCNLV